MGNGKWRHTSSGRTSNDFVNQRQRETDDLLRARLSAANLRHERRHVTARGDGGDN